MKERKCVVALQWSFLGSDWESEVDADVDTSSRTISITFYERIAVYCVCVCGLSRNQQEVAAK